MSAALNFLGIRGLIALGLAVALAAVMWRADRISGQRDAAMQTIAEMKAASIASQRLAERQKAEYEARYRELAERASYGYEKGKTDAMDAAERYIAAHRVQCPNGSAPGGTSPAADDSAAGIPAGVPGPGFVVVSDTDLRACTAATVYAVKAREWALEIAR